MALRILITPKRRIVLSAKTSTLVGVEMFQQDPDDCAFLWLFVPSGLLRPKHADHQRQLCALIAEAAVEQQKTHPGGPMSDQAIYRLLTGHDGAQCQILRPRDKTTIDFAWPQEGSVSMLVAERDKQRKAEQLAKIAKDTRQDAQVRTSNRGVARGRVL
jgi:hypothetical protein